MTKKLVKYQNDLNTALMRRWNEREMNILFCIVAKIKDTNNNQTLLSFEELKELSNSKKNATKTEFVNELISVSMKLGSLNYLERSQNNSNIKLFILFQEFDIDQENEMLTVTVNPQFNYVFNKISIEFTQFELAEFVKIQSTYAKTAYRLLKQYRTTGWWKISSEGFKSLFEVPKSYRSTNIDKKILEPILEQLGGNNDNAIFKNLKITKEKKKGRGRGGIITAYIFEFEAEKIEIREKKNFNYKKSAKKEILPDWFDKEQTEIKNPAIEEEIKRKLEQYYQDKEKA